MFRFRKGRGTGSEWRTAATLLLASIYTALCAEPSTVPLASAIWLLPVALAGYLLGQRAGVGMGIYVALPLALSWYVYGVPPGASFPGLMLSTFVAVLCGFVLGRIHDLNLRLRQRLEKRRTTQAELRDAEEQSRRLLEALPDVICRMDRQGNVLSYQAPRSSSPGRTSVAARSSAVSHSSWPPRLSLPPRSSWPPRITPTPQASTRSSSSLPGAVEPGGSEREGAKASSTDDASAHTSSAAAAKSQASASGAPHADGQSEGARRVEELLPPEVTAEALECINEALETGAVVSFEYPLHSDGSSPRQLEARLAKASDQDVIAIVRDVTAIKQLQRELDDAHRDALEAAGTKGRFLATMSHRIRTPMNGVIGMTNVLLQTKLSPEQREYTSIIRNSGEALLSILDDVLDHAKIESGRMELGRAPFAVRTLLEEIVELLSVRAHDKGIELAAIIDERVPDRVLGDRGRLRQVITNLLGNAVRFTQHGHVVLRGTVVGHDRDTAFIRFDVGDTGVGISRDQQKNLFQDFAQANPAIAREFGGTGLGLAISRQIVELMGGHMLVESAPGEGSTFSFTARFGTAPEHTGSFFLPRSFSGARLLALPLHKLTREVLDHQLSSFGVHLEAARDLREAERKLRKPGGFDLLLLELALGAREDEARRSVAEVTAISRNVPLAVLCGMGHRSVSDAAREAGAALTLTRPLRRAALYEGLGSVLGLTTNSPRRKTHNGEPPTQGGKLRARVLVAEDNLVNQKVAVRSLEMLGCDAEVAANGAAALEALAQGDFDIVLMDCQMPVLDGFQASQRIREIEGANKHTPIIAMTANAMQGDRERCLAAGMDDYVPKPVTLAALDATLRHWLPERVAYSPRTASRDPSAHLEGPS
jgi:signal transduction histidine kinase/CheY-like chemotaxis protein